MIHVSHTTAEDRTVSVDVREATVRDRMRRAALTQTVVLSGEIGKQPSVSNIVEDLLHFNAFPSCVACSQDMADSENVDLQLDTMTFDDFLNLPDQFVAKWLAAVFELNSTWKDTDLVPPMRPSRKPGKTK